MERVGRAGRGPCTSAQGGWQLREIAEALAASIAPGGFVLPGVMPSLMLVLQLRPLMLMSLLMMAIQMLMAIHMAIQVQILV